MELFKEQEYTQSFNIKLWKQLLRYAKPYKKYFIALAIVMACVAGIDTIIPLMQRYVIDNFIIPGDLSKMKLFIITTLVVFSVQTVNILLLILIGGKIEMNLVYDIRKDAFTNLQKLSFSYYDKTPVGWLMARLTTDSSRLSETISWGIVDMLWGLSMMTIIMIIMIVINIKLALITLAIVPALAVISVFFQRKILTSYREVRKINSKITGAYNEGIMGAKTTKTVIRELDNLKEFKDKTHSMYKASVKAAIFSSLFLPIVLTLGSIGSALVLYIGGKSVMMKTLSYGSLVAFFSFTVQFFEPVREIARVLAELQSAQASGERILSLIETSPEIFDSQKAYENSLEMPIIKGDIEFRNVSFSYKNLENVLLDFSLKVKQGETIALVGETGSGKSTIVNLLCRFYEPNKGDIFIDSINYKDMTLDWLHSQIGFVLQSPHLFSGTIAENIRYGNLSSTQEQVIKAAKYANAHDFIMKLENTYDTDVGEGGNKLSTGEKQLISFARAIIADPRILVLDEATASIDTETEYLIQKATEQILKGRTSFVIAHRLSTIRKASRILVIHQGKITEAGTHEELIKRKGYYYKLYANQFMEEHETEILNKQ